MKRNMEKMPNTDDVRLATCGVSADPVAARAVPVSASQAMTQRAVRFMDCPHMIVLKVMVVLLTMAANITIYQGVDKKRAIAQPEGFVRGGAVPLCLEEKYGVKK